MHVKIFQRDNLRLREKHSSHENDMKIQGIDLNTYMGQSNDKSTVEQFFFIDSRNRINLVYPNYEVTA